MSARIHSLHVYPIKSCQGIDLDLARLTATGIAYDRHWMLVDDAGRFLSQRELPQMATIGCRFSNDELVVSGAGQSDLSVPLQQPVEHRIKVQIWNDQCHAGIVSPQASAWFSDYLQRSCQLVLLPETEHRPVDPGYAEADQRVGFADGFPLLVVSLASIDRLSQQLGETVSIDRFRPNIVLDGCEPHAEDDWLTIQAGDIKIRLAKPCSRCVIPSYHQQTAQQHPRLLKTLANYRRRDGKVYFGMNGLHDRDGNLQVGQQVLVTPK